jgi:hypothetical protein
MFEMGKYVAHMGYMGIIWEVYAKFRSGNIREEQVQTSFQECVEGQY